VARALDHRVIIERRGRSHKAVCSCSWSSHSWNELRPAESDAWHHVYGDSVVVDVSSIPDERSAPSPVASGAGRVGGVSVDRYDEHPEAVDQLVRDARELAARPSPYAKDAAPELWRRSGQSRLMIQAAVTELEELLARHDRQSAGAADSEWLQLITAKRLLIDALSHSEERTSGSLRRALI
jgi:hypothetical protein